MHQRRNRPRAAPPRLPQAATRTPTGTGSPRRGQRRGERAAAHGDGRCAGRARSPRPAGPTHAPVGQAQGEGQGQGRQGQGQGRPMDPTPAQGPDGEEAEGRAQAQGQSKTTPRPAPDTEAGRDDKALVVSLRSPCARRSPTRRRSTEHPRTPRGPGDQRVARPLINLIGPARRPKDLGMDRYQRRSRRALLTVGGRLAPRRGEAPFRLRRRSCGRGGRRVAGSRPRTARTPGSPPSSPTG